MLIERLIFDESWSPEDSPDVVCFVAGELNAYMEFTARLLHHEALAGSSVTWQLGGASCDRLAGLSLGLSPDLDSKTIAKTLLDVDHAFPEEDPEPEPGAGEEPDGMGIRVEFKLPNQLEPQPRERWKAYLKDFGACHAERFGPLWRFVLDWESPGPERFGAEIPFHFSDWRNVQFRSHFLERYGAEKLGTEKPFIVSLFGVRPDAVPYVAWILSEVAQSLNGRVLIPSAD